MDKDKIIEYVMNTPGNTNPAVLGSMVDSVGGSDLPPIEAGDAGKVLTVNDGETGVEWATPSGGGIPSYVGYFTVTSDNMTFLVQGSDPLIINSDTMNRLYSSNNANLVSPLVLVYYSTDNNKIVYVASRASAPSAVGVCEWTTEDPAITLHAMQLPMTGVDAYILLEVTSST